MISEQGKGINIQTTQSKSDQHTILSICRALDFAVSGTHMPFWGGARCTCHLYITIWIRSVAEMVCCPPKIWAHPSWHRTVTKNYIYKPSWHLDGAMTSSLQGSESGSEDVLWGPGHLGSESAFSMLSFPIHATCKRVQDLQDITRRIEVAWITRRKWPGSLNWRKTAYWPEIAFIGLQLLVN